MVTSATLGDIIQNRYALGQVAKWVTELMGHHTTYISMTAINSQILVDFVMVSTETQTPPPPSHVEYWTMCFNGSLMVTGAGVGIALILAVGDRLRYAIQLHFIASNNMAEYEALIHGLRITSNLGAQHLYV